MGRCRWHLKTLHYIMYQDQNMLVEALFGINIWSSLYSTSYFFLFVLFYLNHNCTQRQCRYCIFWMQSNMFLFCSHSRLQPAQCGFVIAQYSSIHSALFSLQIVDSHPPCGWFCQRFHPETNPVLFPHTYCCFLNPLRCQLSR